MISTYDVNNLTGNLGIMFQNIMKIGFYISVVLLTLWLIISTVNGISYGACNTPMNSDWINDSKKVEETKRKIPLRWIADPNDIVTFVVNILENFSDYTTGSIFNIDGGRSLN